MSDKHDILKIHNPTIETKGYEYVSAIPPEEYRQWKDIAKKTQNPEYLHWDKIKRKSWLPEVSDSKAWAMIKFFRGGRDTPITAESYRQFNRTPCVHYDEILHNFTHNLSGNLIGNAQIMNDKEKREYITRGLIEEAIASSQLEGANTTRKYALKMITEGLQPQDKSQRMIINNYRAMQKIEQHYKNEPLSLSIIHDLHQTDGVMDQGIAGEFRTDDDDIVINGPDNDGKIAFTPPKMNFIHKEIMRLIDFANDVLETDFVHPVMKAIMLHFWIGYLHPYSDGNGRLARALFYWYLLRNGYWAFAFLPISEAIKKSPVQYGWAYIYSKQDDYDLTYFIDYNLRKILQAQNSFDQYVQKKKKEHEITLQAAKTIDFLNTRQLKIVQFLKSNKNQATNVSGVSSIFGVSQMTAIRDLKDMEARGLITPKRKGKNIFYFPTDTLLKLLEDVF